MVICRSSIHTFSNPLRHFKVSLLLPHFCFIFSAFWGLFVSFLEQFLLMVELPAVLLSPCVHSLVSWHPGPKMYIFFLESPMVMHQYHPLSQSWSCPLRRLWQIQNRTANRYSATQSIAHSFPSQNLRPTVLFTVSIIILSLVLWMWNQAVDTLLRLASFSLQGVY